MSISAEFKAEDGKKVQSFEVVPKSLSSLGDLVDSLRTLQRETNSFLTEVIHNLSKSGVNNGREQEVVDDEDMEGDSEESDSDETPPSKLAKT